jgi:hydrogenase maturation protein HypF
MELEFALEGFATTKAYDIPLRSNHAPRITHHGSLHLDWSPMVEAILADLKRGLPISQISAKFHNTLAETIVVVAKQIGQPRVVLSGGCFQNRYLTERSVRRLQEEGFRPYWHQRVPPNDGGISLGQAVAALRQEWTVRPPVSHL